MGRLILTLKQLEPVRIVIPATDGPTPERVVTFAVVRSGTHGRYSFLAPPDISIMRQEILDAIAADASE